MGDMKPRVLGYGARTSAASGPIHTFELLRKDLAGFKHIVALVDRAEVERAYEQVAQLRAMVAYAAALLRGALPPVGMFPDDAYEWLSERDGFVQAHANAEEGGADVKP